MRTVGKKYSIFVMLAYSLAVAHLNNNNVVCAQTFMTEIPQLYPSCWRQCRTCFDCTFCNCSPDGLCIMNRLLTKEIPKWARKPLPQLNNSFCIPPAVDCMHSILFLEFSTVCMQFNVPYLKEFLHRSSITFCEMKLWKENLTSTFWIIFLLTVFWMKTMKLQAAIYQPK